MQKRTNIYATKAYQLGNSGEKKVKLLLDRFNPEKYNIHNIMLKDGENTHQIDVICITKAGVFVIEVKNVCGYKIKCENDWKYWEYDWIKEGKLVSCKLYNPIMQNHTHVTQIKKLLPSFPVYSLVTFSNNNQLVHQYDLDAMVVNLKNIQEYIQRFPDVLSEGQMSYALDIIKKNHHPEISLNEHIKNVNKYR